MKQNDIIQLNGNEVPSREKLVGRYSNYFKVGYNEFEFLIDFGQLYSEKQEARCHTRIVTLPIYARSFLETLLKSVESYEKTFGNDVHEF